MLDADALALPAGPELDLPARFAARPHLLANARMTAVAAAPHLGRLADFLLPRLPRRPLASDTLHTDRASSGAALLDDAATQPWISFNNEGWTNAIGTDCDHAEAEERVADFMHYLRAVDPAAPAPMIVRDPFTARAHVTWFPERPVYTGPQPDETAARSASVLRTLAAVQRGLAAILGGDPQFKNRLTKNPFGLGRAPGASRPPAQPALWEAYLESGSRLRFHTIPGDCRPISLLTLWRALKAWSEDTGTRLPGPERRRRQRSDAADGEKGTRLFHASRFPVYDLGTSDLGAILAVVDEQAARLGSPAGPRQRLQVARSIARFMRTRYTGTKDGKPRKCRGV
ncbi:replication initiation protein, partial [Roseomonas mucosa]